MEYYVTIGRSKLELHDLKWMNLENKSWVKLMFEIGYLSGDEDVGRKKILLNWGTKIIQLALNILVLENIIRKMYVKY